MNLRWETKFSYVWNVLKNNDIFTAPKKLKYITKEDKDYSEENKSLMMDPDGNIISGNSTIDKNYIHKINYSFNYMRNNFIIVDMSESSVLVDFKPNRLKYVFHKLKRYIKEYFKYNFCSTITIIVSRNSNAEILSPMSNDPNEIIENIDKKIFGKYNNSPQFVPGGYFSLFNCLEAVKELFSSKNSEKFHYDILIINNSLLSYDNTVLNSKLFLLKDRTEISTITLENSFQGLEELTKSTGGDFNQISKEDKNINCYNTNGDMDTILFYYSCRYLPEKSNKIIKPNKRVETKNTKYICFCHKKYQKIIFCCSLCNDAYCYFPFYCRKCQVINIDDTYLNTILRNSSDSDNKTKNNICYPNKLTFFYRKYINDINFKDAAKASFNKLKEHAKDFKRVTNINEGEPAIIDNCPLDFKIKILYYYLKFIKKSKMFYCDYKKNILNDQFDDYIYSQKVIILRENLKCSGCNKLLEFKSENDLDDIIVFSNCLDIFCIECYKYLIDNNLGCLECTD